MSARNEPGRESPVDVQPKRELRNLLQVLLASSLLILITQLLDSLRSQIVADLLALAAWVVGGFAAGARARKPAHQAAIAGAVAYLGALAYVIYRGGGNPSSLPEMPCIPVCNVLVLAIFAALGGYIAGCLLPYRPPYIPPLACRRCGYDLTGNVSGVCPECGIMLLGDRPDRTADAPPSSTSE
jgi:hypothetical protein